MPKTVFVSGCFDLLHSGHIAFLEQAASYGDVMPSAPTAPAAPLPPPVNSEDERLYMFKSIRHVTDAFISTGTGIL